MTFVGSAFFTENLFECFYSTFFFPQRESQILLHYINEITKTFRDLTMELKSNKNVPTHLSTQRSACTARRQNDRSKNCAASNNAKP
jgi:hypothetical protein